MRTALDEVGREGYAKKVDGPAAPTTDVEKAVLDALRQSDPNGDHKATLQRFLQNFGV